MLNVMGGVRTAWYSPGYPPLPYSPAASRPEGITGGGPPPSVFARHEGRVPGARVGKYALTGRFCPAAAELTPSVLIIFQGGTQLLGQREENIFLSSFYLFDALVPVVNLFC